MIHPGLSCLHIALMIDTKVKKHYIIPHTKLDENIALCLGNA
jgi:hypothetical protein